MEVSGQFNASAALPRGNERLSHWVGGWVAPEPICTCLMKKKFLASARN
jgi:hypothetical protein